MFKVTIFYACFNFLSNFNISLRVVAIGILRHFSFRSFLFICFEMELTVKTCFYVHHYINDIITRIHWIIVNVPDMRSLTGEPPK